MMQRVIILITCLLICHTMPAQPTASTIQVIVGKTSFRASLYDNATAAAFRKMLPLELEMVDLNRNEKYADLPHGLPNKAVNPGKIESGDLMLYGSKTLVLFYKDFPTTYRYTKIGRVADAGGLAAALGAGTVTVRFVLE